MKIKAKGISLIILVITIVVMGILATTVIISITGTDIFGLASNTVNESNINNIKEAADIAYKNLLIENFGNGSQITEGAIKQRIIDSGISESNLENISLKIGEEIKVGLKQTVTNSTTINSPVASLVNYTIYGNSVQNGEQTPNSLVEVQSVGNKTKNYFDIDQVLSSNNVKNDGEGNLLVTATTTSSGVSAKSPRNLKDYAPDLEVGKTYVLSATSTGSSKRIYLVTSAQVWTFGTSRTITQKDLDSDVIWYANGNADTTFTAVISDIQIEEGTVATAYESYGYKIPITVNNNNETTTHNIYLDEPLRKIEEYEDYIDFESKKIVRQVKQNDLDGYRWYNYSASTDSSDFYYIANMKPLPLLTANRYIRSSFLNIISITHLNTNIGLSVHDGGIVRVRPDFTEYDTVDKWQTYMDSSNGYIQYVIEPDVKDIELPEINITKGITTISIDTEVSPSKMELFYQYN